MPVNISLVGNQFQSGFGTSGNNQKLMVTRIPARASCYLRFAICCPDSRLNSFKCYASTALYNCARFALAGSLAFAGRLHSWSVAILDGSYFFFDPDLEYNCCSPPY
jgi:hypothetical protein